MAAPALLQRLLGGLRTRWKKIAFVPVLVVAVFLGGYRAHRYVTRESNYCLSCHSDANQSVGLHVHRNQRCQDCHRSDFGKGLAVKVGGWFGSKPSAHGQPDLKKCRTCHVDPKGPKNIGTESGHLIHVVNKPQLTCNQCHAVKSHSTKLLEGACQKCHSKVTMHDSGMTRVTCLSCHDFKAPPTPKGSIPATGCIKCHSGKSVSPNVDGSLLSQRIIGADATHGNVNACRLCHNPHAPDASDRRRGMDCERCHKGVMAQHRQTAIEGHPNCSTCHEVHGPRPKTPGLCARCHESKVPAQASSALAGRHENCSSCHKPHVFKILRAACAECHKQENSTIAAWTTTRHTDCLTCHQGHSESKPASNCVNCHKAQQAHGHPDCIKCHEPHQGKSAVKACLGCHANESAAVADQKPAPHRVCLSCHDQHNAGATLSRCGSCHQKERNLASKSPTDRHKVCTTCHMPHLFQRVTTVCLNCHKQADSAPHAGACLKCHQPHGVAASAALDCRSCHQSVPPIEGKHAKCTTCHSPHKSKDGGPACSACHVAQNSGALSWTPVAHRGCTSCHDRHSPATPKACSECHSPLTSKPLFKGHLCQGCHNQHQAPVPWYSRCAQCHASEAAAIKSLSGTHSNCKGCHEPHTDKLPTCQSCHQGRPGVHAAEGHEKCLSCHESHAVRVQGRDKCLSCHKDKKEHFPKAARCAACHLFK
jgi:hypothetical protein